ncbi:ferric siderophore ABC transporter substrate-binding protein [Chryseobacterium gambrini]|uniref:Ferric siderophore ABC transporter substrate-binding protein n=1 Tax=Chryseobacterium gambrini TaxID=373672 RepID=A0AAJ1VLZ8_9FLAO|nr:MULTISPECIES: ferric siderophore ABC transporter substrate-binding protein [Chryseobacterium]MDN4012199.1 ferric siderophore ABC transporter substrate-binding protein [Chryseobacterium gambrini]MDN4031419.1 ferric siderophore ABC transporter substrate-binding protein [Chryseobacterium gambrini]QWA36927.1 ferric siderophore ABC transporter substrate-binding protein [Chryseobacterium sp. ZHDP1]
MRSHSINKNEQNKDRIKSAVLSILIWSAILLFVFLYKLKPELDEQPEVITTMLVNFGDNRNGNGIEEPADQPGSLAAATEEVTPEPAETTVPETKTVIQPDPQPETKKTEAKEKVITGNNTKTSVPKKEESKAETKKTSTGTSAAKNTKKSGATTANSKIGNGDGKGNAAIGNLIRGRGTKAGSQGDGNGIGNAGDPLGGDGNGDSKVGIDRKLVGFIPGTMGRGGSQPANSCTASGTITIAYTVDKAGNVVSARRSGGTSDPCISSNAISWVKKYVKAEKASVSSTGTYKITF